MWNRNVWVNNSYVNFHRGEILDGALCEIVEQYLFHETVSRERQQHFQIIVCSHALIGFFH